MDETGWHGKRKLVLRAKIKLSLYGWGNRCSMNRCTMKDGCSGGGGFVCNTRAKCVDTGGMVVRMQTKHERQAWDTDDTGDGNETFGKANCSLSLLSACNLCICTKSTAA